MDTKNTPLSVSSAEAGTRLNRFMKHHFPTLTNQIFFKICRSGELRVNSKRVKGNEVLNDNDIIRIPPMLNYLPEEIVKTEDGSKFSQKDLDELKKSIVYEDKDVVVFNKPAGLATQGGTGIKKSLDKMASALFPNDNVSLVHRLDRETSGLILCAKNTKSAQVLAKSFLEKETEKEYLALLNGDVKPKEGIIKVFITKGNVFKDKKSAEDFEKKSGEKPKISITDYSVLESIPNLLSFVLFKLETGRTHQLRLHSAYVLNAPIIGDSIYGEKDIPEKLKEIIKTKNLFLLSYKLTFKQPKSGKTITIKAPIPEFMKKALSYLEFGVNKL